VTAHVAEIPAHEFVRHFGRRQSVSGEAPGRVNLIGEHTDYNGGFVLPTVIPQRTRVAVAANQDGTVRAFSHAVPYDAQRATYVIGQEAPRGDWLDYVQGTTHVLAATGVRVTGFDTIISSNVPLGSGLSSSAALVVALLRALRTLMQLPLDDRAISALAQRVETEFIGIPVGPMDPLACTLGQPGQAVFIDTRALTTELIKLPPGVEIAVVNSGIRHSHATGGYKQRQQECMEAARLLGVVSLRDVDETRRADIDALPSPLDRRARHVVTENARVLKAVEAIRDRNAVQLGRLLDASHASLRDDYEVSLADIDAMVEIARAERGVFGARITGGGFGGAIVILTRAGHAQAVARTVARKARAELFVDAVPLVPA
jgi:galactokinase